MFSTYVFIVPRRAVRKFQDNERVKESVSGSSQGSGQVLTVSLLQRANEKEDRSPSSSNVSEVLRKGFDTRRLKVPNNLFYQDPNLYRPFMV